MRRLRDPYNYMQLSTKTYSAAVTATREIKHLPPLLGPCFSCERSPFAKLGCIHEKRDGLRFRHTVVRLPSGPKTYCLFFDDHVAELEQLTTRGRLVPHGPTDKYGYASSYTLLGRGLGAGKKQIKPPQAPAAKKGKSKPSQKKTPPVKPAKRLVSVPTQHPARSSDTLVHGTIKGIDSIDAKFSLKMGTYSIPTLAGSVVASGRLQAQEFAVIAASSQGAGNVFTTQVATHSAYAIERLEGKLDLSGVPSLSSGELAFISSEVPLDHLSPEQFVAYVNMRKSVRPPMVHMMKVNKAMHKFPVNYVAGARPIHATSQEDLDRTCAGYWYIILYLPCQSAPVATSSATVVSPVAIQKACVLEISGNIALLGRTLPNQFAGVTARQINVTAQTSRGTPVREPNGPFSLGELSFPIPSELVPNLARSRPTHQIPLPSQYDDGFDLVDGICTVVSIVSSAFGFPEAAPVLCMIIEGVAWIVDQVNTGTDASSREKRARQEGAIKARDKRVDRQPLFGTGFAEVTQSALAPDALPTTFPVKLRNSVNQMLSDYVANGGTWERAAAQFGALLAAGFVPFVIEHNGFGPGSSSNAPIAPQATVEFFMNPDGTLLTVTEPPVSPTAAMPVNVYVQSRGETSAPAIAALANVPLQTQFVPQFGYLLMTPSGALVPYRYDADTGEYNKVTLTPEQSFAWVASVPGLSIPDDTSVALATGFTVAGLTYNTTLHLAVHGQIEGDWVVKSGGAPMSITPADFAPVGFERNLTRLSHLLVGQFVCGGRGSERCIAYVPSITRSPPEAGGERIRRLWAFSNEPADSAQTDVTHVVSFYGPDLLSVLYRVEQNAYSTPEPAPSPTGAGLLPAADIEGFVSFPPYGEASVGGRVPPLPSVSLASSAPATPTIAQRMRAMGLRAPPEEVETRPAQKPATARGGVGKCP